MSIDAEYWGSGKEEYYGSDTPVFPEITTPAIEQEQSAEQWEPTPVPVIVQEVLSENLAADSTALMTWNIPAAPGYVQILPHRYKRYKCQFVVNIPAATTLLIAKTPEALSGGSTTTAFAVTNATVPAGIPPYEGQQPLYAAFTGTGPVTVSVMDQGFKPVQ
jgi:hypothetical protein